MSAKITEEDVRHVAKLSRLKLRDEQVPHLAQQLSNVLDYVSKLNELDVSDVEPMTTAMDFHNVLREDAAQPGMDVDTVLRNAPASTPPFFKVPKVLGEGSGA